MEEILIKESTLTAIGDAIREKEGTNELVPTTEMADRIRAIQTDVDEEELAEINADLEQILYGTDTGGKSFYDDFWDNYQENGNRVDYAYGFAGYGWNDNYYKPKYPIKSKDTYMMFARTRISKISGIDFSEAASFDYSFYYSNFLKEIDLGSIPNAKSFSMSFSSGVIETVRMRDVSEVCTFSNTFRAASQLVNVDLTGSIGNDISFSDCKKLSRDSIFSVRNHLSGMVSGKTVTFSRTAVINAGYGDGDTLNEIDWADFCGAVPNWTFSLI